MESGSQSDADSGGESTPAASDRSARAAAKRTGARATETVREWVSRKADENTDAAAEPTGSSTDDGANQSGATSERTLDTSDFPEWPDSARRPEDRTTARSETGSGRAGGREVDASDSDPGRASGSSRTPVADSENTAQADARTGVVSENDIPSGTVEGETTRARREDPHGARQEPPRERDARGDAGSPTDSPAGSERGADENVDPADGRVVSEPSGDRPSIEQLREELNEQFESIKIVRPGEYELNLMELYNREEYIISLQEDGRYVIEVPDAWRDGDQ
nr:Zn-ribbon containing protein [Natrarchaeobaculum aegyptiacum]